MTPAEYRSLTLAEMQQSTWRTTRPLQNGNMRIPEGMAVEITYKRGGLNLASTPCDRCGVSIFIRKVPPSAVERVAANNTTEPTEGN